MSIVRHIHWWKLCLDCNHWQKGSDEYMGFNYWFCSKCGSKHIKGGFIIQIGERDDTLVPH